MEINSISCADALKELMDGAILIDVRENQEIINCAFDIPKVITIPVFNIYAIFHELSEDKKIIVADTDTEDEKSWRGTITLQNGGFRNVAYLEGGMKEWLSKGLPVIKSEDYLNLSNSRSCCK